jgi:sugar phosphate isomerase/epimerase
MSSKFSLVGIAGFALILMSAVETRAVDPWPPPVPGYPIGRCVQVLGVTAPEDAKTAGFEYLELALQNLLPLSDAEFAGVVTRLKAVGLPAISGYGYLPADLKIVGPDVDLARMERELRRGLDRAQQLGLTLVVHGNLLGKTRTAPEGFSRETALKQLADFGRLAAREAKARGITVLFEPMPPRNANLVNSVAEGLVLVEAVNHPNFQLLVDYGFFVETKEDLAVLHRAAPHIRQIEIQNPNGRVYPQRAEEADYAGFFRALKKGGYRGGFSIHGKPTDFFVDAPRAIAMLRGVAAAELLDR